MTTVTSAEIAQARSALEDTSDTESALTVIEECNGNLEDAFEALIVESDLTDEANRQSLGESLEQFAAKCRKAICQEEFREEIVDGFSRDLLNTLVPIITAQLTLMGNLPVALAIPLAMYVIKRGIKQYCNSPAGES